MAHNGRITTGKGRWVRLPEDTDGRVRWIDAARGVGIIIVVAGHVERGLVAANIAQDPVWAWMDYGLYTFHMPLFFLLAGLNVPASLAKGRRRFLLAKMQNIAWPYLLWSLIQGSVLVALSSLTNGQAHVSDLLQVGWRPMAQFWFLYVLMACQLAALPLVRRPRWLAGVAAVAFGLASVLPQGGVVEEFCHAFPFFAAGILLSRRWLTWELGGGDAARAALAAVGLAVTIPVSGWLDGRNFDSALALPSAVCGILLLVSVSRLLTNGLLAASVALGRMSMSIYVMHILAAAGARIGLVRLQVPPNPWLYLVLCTLAGIVVPVLAHILLVNLKLAGLFGLVPIRRAERRVGSAPQSVTL